MADNITIRQMPYSLEAEQALLGAAIADPETLNRITFLEAEDFYLSQHQRIFAALKRMFHFDKQVDMVTLLDELSKSESFGGTDAVKYVKLLVESAAVSPNVEGHAAIVHDKSVLRKLIKVSQEISDSAYTAAESVDSIVEKAEKSVFDIAGKKYNEGFTHIAEAINEEFELLSKRVNDPESLRSSFSHFADLDNMIRFGPGDLIVIGGRPGMGKTTFAMNIAANVAKTPRKDGTMPDVAVFSLEMTKQQLTERLLSSEAMVDSRKLMRGRIEPEDWKKLGEATSRLAKTQLLIDESAEITVTKIKAKLRRLENLALVVVDYLQLMHADEKIENRVLEIGAITRGFKLMAKDLGVPIVLCSQLRRDVGTGRSAEKMPQMQDLRDSGAIEQDADVVIFLHRDDYANYEKEDTGDVSTAKALVAKNRHGSTGVVDLSWYGPCYKFFTVERRYEQEQ